jgi:hypothetical protein
MAGQLGLITSLLSMLGQQSSTQPGRTGMQSLFSFQEGGGGGGLLGGSGFAGKDTYGSTGKSIAGNIFDPGGFMRPGKKKKAAPTMEELMDRMMAWRRAQPEYIAYQTPLSEMSAENKYGSLQPDWGDILDRTIKKTQQVYRGSPTTTGAQQKMRADVAARGMTDSPALGKQMLALGAQEAQDVGDITTTIAEQERAMTENARQDWLNRLASMAGFGTTMPDLSQLFQLDALQTPKPSGANYSGLGASLADMFSQKQQPTRAIPKSPITNNLPTTYGSAYKPMEPVTMAGGYNTSFGDNPYSKFGARSGNFL